MAANDKMNLPAQTTLNATLADVPPRYEPSGMVVLTSVWSRRHHEARRTHGRLCSSEPQPTTRPCLQVRRHAASAPTHPIMHPYAQSRALTQACVKMHAMAGTVCTRVMRPAELQYYLHTYVHAYSMYELETPTSDLSSASPCWTRTHRYYAQLQYCTVRGSVGSRKMSLHCPLDGSISSSAFPHPSTQLPSFQHGAPPFSYP